MILIIDNYDSFTYNLYQFIGEIDPDVRVVRNDKIGIEDVPAMDPSHIILSPGPGFPADAGICTDLVRKLGRTYPILGVCLGHQAIGEAYGGRVVHAPSPVHGKASDVILHDGCGLFNGLPQRIKAGRYHSLIVDRTSLPQELHITAETDDGHIMGLEHRDNPVYGIQFHPESVLTPDGKRILSNFIKGKGRCGHVEEYDMQVG